MKTLSAIGSAFGFLTLVSCVSNEDFAVGKQVFHDTDSRWEYEESEVVRETTGNILSADKYSILIRDEITGEDQFVVDPFGRIPPKLEGSKHTIRYLFGQSKALYKGSHGRKHYEKTLLAIMDFRKDMVKDMSKCPRHGVVMRRGWTKGVSVTECSDAACEHVTREFPAAGIEFQPCNGYLGIKWICPVCREGLDCYEPEGSRGPTECSRRGCRWHDYSSE
jgi:hypothetical protein